jgi:hypothetical protein
MSVIQIALLDTLEIKVLEIVKLVIKNVLLVMVLEMINVILVLLIISYKEVIYVYQTVWMDFSLI